jgi:LacI family transcriptional regulator
MLRSICQLLQLSEADLHLSFDNTSHERMIQNEYVLMKTQTKPYLLSKAKEEPFRNVIQYGIKVLQQGVYTHLKSKVNHRMPRVCYAEHVITIHDVARLAGVSYATAQRAVRQPELLAPNTLKRVQEAIDKLYYEPHQLASTLRGGQSKTIGLMVGDILEPTFAQFTRIIGQHARKQGYSLLLADDEYDAEIELSSLKMFYGHRIGGLIIRPAYASNYDYLKRLEQRGVAIVEIDYTQDKSPFSWIMLDNEAASFEAVKYLYDLGHRHIAYVGRAAMEKHPEERYTGFMKALKTYKLNPPKSYLIPLAKYGEDLAYERTKELLSLPKPPTAILAFNGTCMLSAYQAIRDKGLQIPTEISLLGFDNYPWTKLVSPGIDVLEQPVQDMALAAVEAVIAKIEGTKKLIRQRFPAKLIKRGSCAAPNVT